MTEPRPEVKAVLWDADGVLQHGRRDWVAVFTEIGGQDFPRALFAAEGPALRGEESLRTGMSRLLTEWQLDVHVDDLVAMWEQIDVDAAAFDLIAKVRAAGTPCHLATNQHDYRVRFMREELGYDRHFDRTYYSSEVGAMKPQEAYFRHVLEDLGLAAGSVVFIDDNAGNIEAARALGVHAVQHDPAEGAAGLHRILADAGVGIAR